MLGAPPLGIGHDASRDRNLPGGAGLAGCHLGFGRFSRWHHSPSIWDGNFSCVFTIKPFTSLGPLSVSLDAMRWSRLPLPTHFCTSPSHRKPWSGLPSFLVGRSGRMPHSHRLSHSQRFCTGSLPLPFFFLSAFDGGGGLSRPMMQDAVI